MALKINLGIFSFILVAVIFLGWGMNLAFAQESFFAARDNFIFASLNQVEAKQKAMTDAIMEAQMKLAESKPSRRIEGKEKSASGFSDIASRAHPYFLLTTVFDSNLDNVRYDRKSSLINTATPGLKINFKGPSASANLDVLVNNKFYNSHPKSDN